MIKDCYCNCYSGCKIKRKFKVYDIRIDRYVTAECCAMALRYYIMTECCDGINDYITNTRANNVIESLIRKHFDVPEITLNKGFPYDLMKQKVIYQICERPYILCSMTIEEALTRINDGVRSDFIVRKVFTIIQEYLNRNSYKKYKAKYNEAEKIINRIKKGNYSQGVEIINLLNIIFELTIKKKKEYATIKHKINV